MGVLITGVLSVQSVGYPHEEKPSVELRSVGVESFDGEASFDAEVSSDGEASFDAEVSSDGEASFDAEESFSAATLVTLSPFRMGSAQEQSDSMPMMLKPRRMRAKPLSPQ